MKKLKILKIDGINYVLEDERKNIFNVSLSFFCDEKPNVNDQLVFNNENLLDKKSEEYIGDYTFGDISDKAGFDVNGEKDKDLLFIINGKNNMFVTKRIYG